MFRMSISPASRIWEAASWRWRSDWSPRARAWSLWQGPRVPFPEAGWGEHSPEDGVEYDVIECLLKRMWGSEAAHRRNWFSCIDHSYVNLESFLHPKDWREAIKAITFVKLRKQIQKNLFKMKQSDFIDIQHSWSFRRLNIDILDTRFFRRKINLFGITDWV